ncbi:Imidazolonepropionase [Jeotgalicoccus aerolatus]|uniref:Imidazolonepropionase n=1 Tax=Jeotgalicoccus aerolatus TaxID=709510 RepID=A0ABS4HR53_9STAP|nr:imidazolonepropionase [Jeotgalicoccus aerolatus]MBP1953069.1 imidazolonepropionase [Jeotgalicoccus aerolatus]GGE02202.1 imidazolonepropionase [Jeotgalicoccus aerolatus]CAD2073057.1 Imidazolonepropionase [Jeotgalicoccus aerolatus]HJG33543.1 imidazolonepropionase [Jeotgalicoccus aerolatus]
MNDVLITNIKSLILPKKTETPLKGKEMDELNIVEDAIVVIKDGKVVYAGAKTDDYEAKETIDAEGKIVSPALVEPHTHIVHGGSREHEMSMKRQGVDYLTILEQGGGILNTVKQTREASFDELLNKASVNMTRMIQHGVLTVESKSGYGLDRENELKQLKVSKALEEKFPVLMRHTFLGPHAIPKGRQAEEFLQEMTDLLDEVKDYADFADIFTETGVFSVEQSRKYMEAAKEKGFRVKIHADEIDPLGGLELAIEQDAISADHLVAASETGKKQLADSDTVAVLLPGTTFYLGKNEFADARSMIDQGGAVSLATDYNPGSCVTDNLQMIMAIAALKLKMTPNEIWNAVTVNAAHAIDADRGTLNAGDDANIVVWDAPNHEYIPYHYGVNHAYKVFADGKLIFERPVLNL